MRVGSLSGTPACCASSCSAGAQGCLDGHSSARLVGVALVDEREARARVDRGPQLGENGLALEHALGEQQQVAAAPAHTLQHRLLVELARVGLVVPYLDAPVFELEAQAVCDVPAVVLLVADEDVVLEAPLERLELDLRLFRSC